MKKLLITTNVFLGAVICLLFLSSSNAQQNTPPVISNATTTINISFAKIIWEAFDDDGLSDYSLNYGPSTSYGLSAKIDAKSLEGEDGTRYFLSSEISGLEAGAKIYYVISVKDTHNEVETYTGNFTMPAPDYTAPIISRVSAVPQSQNATVSWVTDEPSTSEVRFWKSGFEPLVVKETSLVNNHYLFLDKLSSNETYNFQVISVDASSNKSYSAEQTFKTGGVSIKPNDVSGLRISVANNAFVLSWKNPNDQNFDGVRIVKKVGSASEFVLDGSTVFQGRGETFTDRSVVQGKKYFYTVYSYDQNNNYSGGTLIEGYMGQGGSLVTAIPEATVTGTGKLYLKDFKFYISGNQLEILSGDILSDRAGSRLSINLSSSLLKYIPETIFVRISGQEIHKFSPPAEQNNYYSNFLFPDEGRHESYIQIDYSNGLRDVIPFVFEAKGSVTEKPVVRTTTEDIIVIKPVVEVPKLKDDYKMIGNAAKNVSEIVKSEEVKEVVSDVVVPAAVSVAAVGTFASIPSWFTTLPFFHLVILQPFVVLGRRKRYGWGQVYNSSNKMPIDLAVVRLINQETGRIVQSKVTDNEGRYAFVVNPGKYIIQVIKGKFVFPSAILNDVKNDGQKIDIYHGEVITVTDSDGVVAPNIPIDPLGEFEKPSRLFWQKIIHKVQVTLSWTSLIVTVVSLYLAPKWHVWVLLGVNFFLFALFRRLAKPPKIKSWGIVFNSKTKQPIDHAVVRLFSEQYNKLIATQVTDIKGRYYFMAGANKYYLTCEHPMYDLKKTSSINISGNEAENITLDLGLKPISTK